MSFTSTVTLAGWRGPDGTAAELEAATVVLGAADFGESEPHPLATSTPAIAVTTSRTRADE
ncbi:hypothetical protein [Nocardia sp. SYP-A9097]|uniref:hypothetical protein n=1 Tax=Nocardia sp. SYP-A9097 TaxID=2663237 RepID=UPI001E3150D8|nr:hypothetical protein [Nocardia sp. SYP-A9097]